MANLKKNDILKSVNCKTVTINDKLAEGGQGTVYKVDYDGKPMALKWYFIKKINDLEKFKDNLVSNINRGKPSDSFLWSLDLVEGEGGDFGYIMELRPSGFYELAEYLVKRVKFTSTKAVVNAAIDICSAFRALHNKGLSYQDLNDGNFFISPNTGRVLVCDNDNVAPDRENTGIMGKCRYMAPEIVVGKELPNQLTDRFSLAVVLFMLLFRGHPFEGKRTLVPCMTEKHERKFYGEDPIFVYDNENDSNRPSRGVHDNVLKCWTFFPESVRELFMKAFSQDAVKDPNKRVNDRVWVDMFIKLRDSMIDCPYCNGQFFADVNENVATCPDCRKSHPRPGKIQCGNYIIPLSVGNKLYNCHAEGISDDKVDCFKEIGEIIIGKNKIEGKPPVMGIRNLSDKEWKTVSGDKNANVAPNGVARVVRGLEIDLGNDYKAKII